jgi:hypothetical protein
VAIDGTKIGAVASKRKVITPQSLAKQNEAIERKIAGYLASMDETDAQEEAVQEPRIDVAKALSALKERKERIGRQAEELARDGLSQLVSGERDARLMSTVKGFQVAYNAQIAVDSAHKMIVAFDLTNEGNDTNQLHPMAEKAKLVLGAESLIVVADTGYSNGEQGERCETAGIVAIVPRPERRNTAGVEYFDRSRFIYDAAGDTYRCPAGQTLTPECVSRTQAKTSYANLKACQGCALKGRCTKGRYRRVHRSLFEDATEAMHRRAMADRKWMKKRSGLAEHPFGTIKFMMGRPRFLVRGLKKAKAEWALSVLCYNLKRLVNLVGVHNLLLRFQSVTA